MAKGTTSTWLRPYLEDIENLYKAEWGDKSERIMIDEIPVELPIMPHPKKIRNFGLPIEQQKFRPIKVPHDLKKWDRASKEKFIAAMWHKRKNGEWWYIKGQPIYLNRYAWTFYNFWHTELGGLPQFRIEGVEFFLAWQACVRSKDCLGIYDIKPRRIGDTEKALFITWEVCSRVRGSKAGQQNVTEEDAKKNFKRLVDGNKKMPFFFKPVMPMGDAPKSEIIFDYPPQYLSSEKKGKKIEAAEEEAIPPLGSFMDYQPTIEGKYDGGRATIYYCDEPGKIKAFNINSQWKKVKPTLTLNNNKNIIGKAIFTTTVEDFVAGDSSTLENAETMWKQSDRNNLGPDGRTISGLWRIFRSARMSAEVDEWGFHKSDEAEKQILANREMLEKISDWDGLSEQKRKFPLTVEDVFAPSHNECVLFPAMLTGRKNYLKQSYDELNGIEIQKRIAKPGNLRWKDRFGGEVVWEETPKGRWHISQHPIAPNSRMKGSNGTQSPGMDSVYTFGVDPIDALAEGVKVSRNGILKQSLGAGCVYRKYDELVDGDLEKDEYGDIIETEKMMTGQYVCDYQFRPDDPYEYFEDMLLTAVYYGVSMFFEKNKPSIQLWFKHNGFGNYLLDRPEDTKTNPRTQNKRGRRKKNVETGASATNPLIRIYVDALKVQVYKRIGTFWHPRILACHSLFNVKNRTERDLTVAAAFSKLADLTAENKTEVEQAKDDWSSFIFKRYKYNKGYISQ